MQGEDKQDEEKIYWSYAFVDGASEVPSAAQIALKDTVLPTVRFIGNFPLTIEENTKVIAAFTSDENQTEKEPVGMRRTWKDGVNHGFGRPIFDGTLI